MSSWGWVDQLYSINSLHDIFQQIKHTLGELKPASFQLAFKKYSAVVSSKICGLRRRAVLLCTVCDKAWCPWFYINQQNWTVKVQCSWSNSLAMYLLSFTHLCWFCLMCFLVHQHQFRQWRVFLLENSEIRLQVLIHL